MAEFRCAEGFLAGVLFCFDRNENPLPKITTSRAGWPICLGIVEVEAGGCRQTGEPIDFVYPQAYIQKKRCEGMATARVFKSGNSQAVRLPKKFRVNSKELEISRRGDEIVLREKGKGLERVLDILADLPDDMFPEGRNDKPPQRRKGL
jgi:antitoxin VapB